MDIKRRLKRLGRGLVNLVLTNEDILMEVDGDILIIDNGYASLQQIEQVIAKIVGKIRNGKISILTFGHRKEFLTRQFPQIKLYFPKGAIIKKYIIANQMLRMSNNRYSFIVLLSLDITPIIVSLLFMKGRVLLYNRFQQWWTLSMRNPAEILFGIPKMLLNILIFNYLLVVVTHIFLRRIWNTIFLRVDEESL